MSWLGRPAERRVVGNARAPERVPRFRFVPRPLSTWVDSERRIDEQLQEHPPSSWPAGLDAWAGKGEHRFAEHGLGDLSDEIKNLYTGSAIEHITHVSERYDRVTDMITRRALNQDEVWELGNISDALGVYKARWPPMTNLFESTARVAWSDSYLPFPDYLYAEYTANNGPAWYTRQLVFPTFDAARARCDGCTLALAFTQQSFKPFKRLHAFAVVLWCDDGTLHAAVYDPIFAVRKGKEHAGDTVQLIELSLEQWSRERGGAPWSMHHVGRMCIATPTEEDASRIHCVQYIINAEYCSIFSMRWLIAVAARLEDGAARDDALLRSAVDDVGGYITASSSAEATAAMQIRIAGLAAAILAAFVEDNKGSGSEVAEEMVFVTELETWQQVNRYKFNTGIDLLGYELARPARTDYSDEPPTEWWEEKDRPTFKQR